MQSKPLPFIWTVLQILAGLSLLPALSIWLWSIYRAASTGEAPGAAAFLIFFVPPPLLAGLFIGALTAFRRYKVRLGQALTIATFVLASFAAIFYVVLYRAIFTFQ